MPRLEERTRQWDERSVIERLKKTELHRDRTVQGSKGHGWPETETGSPKKWPLRSQGWSETMENGRMQKRGWDCPNWPENACNVVREGCVFNGKENSWCYFIRVCASNRKWLRNGYLWGRVKAKCLCLVRGWKSGLNTYWWLRLDGWKWHWG